MNQKNIEAGVKGIAVGVSIVFMANWVMRTADPTVPWDTAFAQSGELALVALAYTIPVMYAFFAILNWMLVRKLSKSLDEFDRA